MPVEEARSEDTPYGRYVTSAGWFVLNLGEPVSEVGSGYGASVANETSEPDEAYADWAGEWEPVRLTWQVS